MGNRTTHFYVLGSLVLTLVILIVLRPVFWRPFTTSSESQDSYIFLEFAQANSAPFGWNSLVAHKVNLESSTVEPYNHWTNGYYLLANILFRIFGAVDPGNQMMILRSLAVIAFIAAAYLIVAAVVAPRYPLIYLAVPLAFLTNAGRDAIPFVWRDLLFMSIGLYFIVRSRERPLFKYLFWASLVILPLFLQTVLAYFFFFVLVDYLIHREKKIAYQNFFWLGVGALIVFLVLLLAFPGSIAKGWQGLTEAVRNRSLVPVDILENNPTVTFVVFIRLALRRIYEALNLGLLGIFFVVTSWIFALKRREWWIVALIPSWIFYALVFRGAVFANYYSYFPHVFLSLVTFLYGVDLFLSWLRSKLEESILSLRFGFLKSVAAQPGMTGAVFLFLALNFYLYPTIYPIQDRVRDRLLAANQYPPDPMVQIAKSLNAMSTGAAKSRIETLGCNAFTLTISSTTDGWVPGGAPAVLGRYVLERLNRN